MSVLSSASKTRGRGKVRLFSGEPGSFMDTSPPLPLEGAIVVDYLEAIRVWIAGFLSLMPNFLEPTSEMSLWL